MALPSSSPAFCDPFDPQGEVVTTDRLEAYMDEGRPMLNNYIRHAKIGEGHHGEVHLCYQTNPRLPHGHPHRRRAVAMKSVKRENVRVAQLKRLRAQRLPTTVPAHTPLVDNLGSMEARIRKEIAIMKKCRHPHVVRLYEVIDDRLRDKVYMVMEYLGGGEVKWRNAREEPILTLAQTRRILRDAVLGLEYLHHQGIIHRDIKPANLLWTADRRLVKIADFGTSHFSHALLLASGFHSHSHPHVHSDAVGEAACTCAGSRGRGCAVPCSCLCPDAQDPVLLDLDDSELLRRDGTPKFMAPELVYEHTTGLSGEDGEGDGEGERGIRDEPSPTVASEINISLGFSSSPFSRTLHPRVSPIPGASSPELSPVPASTSLFPVSSASPPPPSSAATLSRHVQSKKRQQQRPPITKAIDVWALGVTLYCLLFGRTPFAPDPNAGGLEWSLYNAIANEEWDVPVEADGRMGAEKVWVGQREREQSAGRQGRDGGKGRKGKSKEKEREREGSREEEEAKAVMKLLERLLDKNPVARVALDEVKRTPWLLADLADPESWLELTQPRGKIAVSVAETSVAMSSVRFRWNWGVGAIISRRISSLFKRGGNVVFGSGTTGLNGSNNAPAALALPGSIGLAAKGGRGAKSALDLPRGGRALASGLDEDEEQEQEQGRGHGRVKGEDRSRRWRRKKGGRALVRVSTLGRPATAGDLRSCVASGSVSRSVSGTMLRPDPTARVKRNKSSGDDIESAEATATLGPELKKRKDKKEKKKHMQKSLVRRGSLSVGGSGVEGSVGGKCGDNGNGYAGSVGRDERVSPASSPVLVPSSVSLVSADLMELEKERSPDAVLVRGATTAPSSVASGSKTHQSALSDDNNSRAIGEQVAVVIPSNVSTKIGRDSRSRSPRRGAASVASERSGGDGDSDRVGGRFGWGRRGSVTALLLGGSGGDKIRDGERSASATPSPSPGGHLSSSPLSSPSITATTAGGTGGTGTLPTRGRLVSFFSSLAHWRPSGTTSVSGGDSRGGSRHGSGSGIAVGLGLGVPGSPTSVSLASASVSASPSGSGPPSPMVERSRSALGAAGATLSKKKSARWTMPPPPRNTSASGTCTEGNDEGCDTGADINSGFTNGRRASSWGEERQVASVGMVVGGDNISTHAVRRRRPMSVLYVGEGEGNASEAADENNGGLAAVNEARPVNVQDVGERLRLREEVADEDDEENADERYGPAWYDEDSSTIASVFGEGGQQPHIRHSRGTSVGGGEEDILEDADDDGSQFERDEEDDEFEDELYRDPVTFSPRKRSAIRQEYEEEEEEEERDMKAEGGMPEIQD